MIKYCTISSFFIYFIANAIFLEFLFNCRRNPVVKNATKKFIFPVSSFTVSCNLTHNICQEIYLPVEAIKSTKLKWFTVKWWKGHDCWSSSEPLDSQTNCCTFWVPQFKQFLLLLFQYSPGDIEHWLGSNEVWHVTNLGMKKNDASPGNKVNDIHTQ